MTREEFINAVTLGLRSYRKRIPAKISDDITKIILGELPPGLEADIIKATKEGYQHVRKGGCLIISGSIGCGKSVTACMYGISLGAKEEYTVKTKFGVETHRIWKESPLWYVSTQEILDNADSRVKLKVTGMTEYRRLNSCIAAMIIDDLGIEHIPTDRNSWALKVYEDLLYNRHQKMRSTIITTNLNEFEIKKRYGSRIESRMNSQWVKYIRFDGPDLRRITEPEQGQLYGG